MSKTPPLCIDLDGTLIYSDLLLESFFVLLKQKPWYIFFLPWWLWKGKAYLKRCIAQHANIEVETLPYNHALLAWLRTEHASGRTLILCTASDNALAQPVAEYLGLFSQVIASDGITNLSGSHKAARLCQAFGERGFDYAGNAAIDLAIWSHARYAIAVNASSRLIQKAQMISQVTQIFPAPTESILHIWLHALRVHQWAKNALVLVPLFAAHAWNSYHALSSALLAFLFFSLCASSVYLLNDLLDLSVDRHHPRKCKRPFAAGTLPLLHGVIAIPLLLGISLSLALWLLPLEFSFVLLIYIISTLLYSIHIKKIVLVDVLMLAGLYSIRIISGAFAISIELSFWLLALSMFLFLSLAILKRYSELLDCRSRGQELAKGRGYQLDDLPLLLALGTASGYLSVLVLALYINSPDSQQLYHHHHWLWLVCPLLLFWISRAWLKGHRQLLHDDPLIYALRDWGSRILMLAVLVVVGLAL